MQDKKNELYELLDGLYEIEQNQESLEFILELLEECYAFSEHKEIRILVNFSKSYTKAVKQDLSGIIERLDEVLSK